MLLKASEFRKALKGKGLRFSAEALVTFDRITAKLLDKAAEKAISERSKQIKTSHFISL